MVAFTPDFITCDSNNLGKIEDVASKNNYFLDDELFSFDLGHINYIRNIAGVESLGLGADYDGIEQ